MLAYSILLICGTYMMGFAQVVNVSHLEKSIKVGRWAKIYQDPSYALTIQDVESLPAKAFISGNKNPLDFQSKNGVTWLKLEIASGESKQVVLELVNSMVESMQLYSHDSLGNWQVTETGILANSKLQSFKHWSASLPLYLRSGEKQTIYLRVNVAGNVVAPLRIWNEGAFISYSHKQMSLIGFFFGVLLGAILVVALSYIIFREKIAFSYVFLLIAWLLFIATESGTGTRFFFPDWWVRLADFQLSISLQLLIMAFLEFTRRSLDLRDKAPFWNKIILGCIGVLGVYIPLGIIWYSAISEAFLSIQTILASLLLIFVVVNRIRAKQDVTQVAIGLGIPLVVAIMYALERVVFSESSFIKIETVYWSLLSMVIFVIYGFLKILQKMQLDKIQLHQEILINLEKADQLKDTFLANTSHELRTPLNGIIGIAEGMRHDPQSTLPLRAKRNLDHVIRSGKRLANLINDLLDHAKLRKGEIDLELRTIELRPLVGVVCNILNSLARKKGIELKNLVPSDLPLISADEDRLQQILINLIGNAIKFTEKGFIEVRARKTEGFVEISIVDTGIGIAASDLSSIFEMFKQVDSSITRNFGGTGIGLSLTKRLIELHGGAIWVQSAENVGSAFSFTMPIGHGQTGQNPIISANKIDDEIHDFEEISSFDGPSKGEVLVVDDEVVNLQIFQNILVPAGYRVKLFSKGQDAIDYMAKGHLPDLVILDLMMPIISGYDVCSQIRLQHNASLLPIIIMTAKNQTKELKQALELGANDFLPKPFEKDEMLARIRLHLQASVINRGYARFVPQEFLAHMQKNDIIHVKLGDQIEQDVAILFMDMRNFTSHCDKMTPDATFGFLNEYMQIMAPRIRSAGGFISRFIGDAILALFPGGGNNALEAALSIEAGLALMNVNRLDELKLKAGVAIHYGAAVIGTIGFQSRMDIAIVSDKVQTTMDLERLNKIFGTSIIIAEEVKANLTCNFVDRLLGFVGHGGSAYYEVAVNSTEPQWLRYRKEFENAVEEFWNGDRDLANNIFLDLREKYPDDKAIIAYVDQAVLANLMEAFT